MIAIHNKHRQRQPLGSSKICKLQTPQRPASLSSPPRNIPCASRCLLIVFTVSCLALPRLASRYRTLPYLTAVPELHPVLTQTRQARNISVWCVLQTWDEARLATNFEYHLLFRHYRTIHSQIRHANIVLAVFVEPPILCNLPEPLPL
ncbi:hypothetical protein CABS01_01667 [Colletotrichum abscissum]|uniref:Uncharacterized protein n=1 Tax=Colletotrichum abscissum TaxID=1671311 RepID=A0A9P9X5X3_9PEZI|nr:uncharacterized protein CABS01_01667 [Colletotrichum abscissum]KAI3537931.1 hypothetical protein CABS02_11936 [Colletotrichum abscissum]KAK1495860.1 hypothetical protein CABS01_01667 [Colletotrichum abscissum]